MTTSRMIRSKSAAVVLLRAYAWILPSSKVFGIRRESKEKKMMKVIMVLRTDLTGRVRVRCVSRLKRERKSLSISMGRKF